MADSLLTARLPIREKVRNYRMRLPDGRTPPMGVGCAWVGKRDGTTTDERLDVDLLLQTYESGFRFYDTAREYGDSELYLGDFLKEIPREEIFLATKADFANHHRDFDTFRTMFFESFDRMGVDHIDCYQIHDCRSFEPCLAEVIPFLVEQREKGLISYIGMGTRSVTVLELAARSGYFDSLLSFMNYSLIKKSAEPLIKLSQELGLAFYNASVFHFGLIKNPDPSSLRVQRSFQLRYCDRAQRMHDLCRRIGVDVIAAAVQISLLNSGVDMLLNGIKRRSNLESTLQAINTPIYPDQWAEIFALQAEDPYLYLQEDEHD
jgi:aryl-alcohol dehydrogenase-like predicted oxidoreductase